MDVVERALIFATAAHAAVGQKRKYTGEDYIVHPIAVMELVRSVPHDDNMLAVLSEGDPTLYAQASNYVRKEKSNEQT